MKTVQADVPRAPAAWLPLAPADGYAWRMGPHVSRRSRTRWTLLCLAWLAAAAQADGVRTAGDVLRIAIPAAGLGVTLLHEDGRQGTWQFAGAIAASTLFTQAVKIAADKRRPDGDCCDSFPSGHSSMAFMGAAFIHRRYGLKYAALPYLGAAFVAHSRVHAKRHDVEDVLAGAAIGIAASWLFTTRYAAVQIAPLAGADRYGLLLAARW